MWHTIFGILAVMTAGQAGPAAGAGDAPKLAAPPPQVRIALDLSDGSHVIGAPAADGLDVATAYGTAHLKWSAIRSIVWKAGESTGRFDMQNGDTVSGRVAQENLDLKTLVGPVTIPLGHVRRLTVIGGGAATTGATFSLRFDGNQNFVTVPDDAALDPTEAMTLECWFKSTATRPLAILGKRQWEPDHWPGPDDHGYQIHLSGGQLIGYWEGNSLFGHAAADGQWHHAAMTWDGTTRRLFQDGVMVAEDAPGVWKPIATDLRLGGSDGRHGRSEFFEGMLSQVRLSKVDRYRGRNFTPPLQFTADADTVCCWDFSEGSGTTLRDSSGHGHEGTLSGDPPPEWVNEAPTAVPLKRHDAAPPFRVRVLGAFAD